MQELFSDTIKAQRRSLTCSMTGVDTNIPKDDLAVSHTLAGVDLQFLEAYESTAPGTNEDEMAPGQYYCDFKVSKTRL